MFKSNGSDGYERLRFGDQMPKYEKWRVRAEYDLAVGAKPWMGSGLEIYKV